MRVVLTYWEALSDVSELSLKSLLYFSSNGSYCILIIPIDRYSNDVFFQYRCRYRCWRLEYDNSLWRYCSCCDSLWIVMLLIPHWPLPLCNTPHPTHPPLRWSTNKWANTQAAAHPQLLVNLPKYFELLCHKSYQLLSNDSIDAITVEMFLCQKMNFCHFLIKIPIKVEKSYKHLQITPI